MSRWAKRVPAWTWLLLLGWWLVVWFAEPASNFQAKLTLAGDPARLGEIASSVSSTDARWALLLDTTFAIAFLLIATSILYVAPTTWAPSYRRTALWSKLWIAALVAGALDLVENALSLLLIDHITPTTAWTVALTTIAWYKFVAYGAAVFGILYLVAGPTLPERVPQDAPPRSSEWSSIA